MPVVTRPYFLTYKGQHFMVEAPSPAAAVKHVVGAEITELRPARGSEVNAWHKAGKPIPLAGERAAGEQIIMSPDSVAAEGASITTAAAAQPPDVATMDKFQLRAWLIGHGAGDTALSSMAAMFAQDRLTLEQYDSIRTECPAFGVAIARGPDDAIDLASPNLTAQIDNARAYLEEDQITLERVMFAVAAYAKVEAEIVTE